MPSTETVVIAATLLAAVAFVGGMAGVLYQFAPDNPRRVPLRARYRRGRHHATPPLWARLLEAYLTGAREMTAANALWRGATPWT